jgi:uncharacterized protein YjiS (DUF1127 family)
MDALNSIPTAHSAAIEAVRQDAMHQRDAQVGSWFRNAFRAIVEYPSRRRVMDELSMLSDRELADIGLNRGDIAGVFNMQDSRVSAPVQSATVHKLSVAKAQSEVTFQSRRIAA